MSFWKSLPDTTRFGIMAAGATGLVIALIAARSAPSDPAELDFKRCEVAVQGRQYDEARSACARAAQASPTSPFGKRAKEQLDQITGQITEAEREEKAALDAKTAAKVAQDAVDAK